MMPGVDALDSVALGLFGLLIGSFLNVVIYRLPIMMERQWALESAELTDGKSSADHSPVARFNLMVPRSRCPQCGHDIQWYENVPVLSYMALRGKCRACHAGISARYPAVELLCAAFFAWCGGHWGLNWTGVAWCGFSAALLALACIDWDTTLLPDDITLPLLWSGLCAAGLGLIDTSLPDALWGAVVGYLSLWLVYWSFKLITGKEGMGYGDFKLYAALGAWLGWQSLISIILMASLMGSIVGIGIKIFSQLRENDYVPFGPFLAIAGITAMIAGPKLILIFINL